MKHLSLYGYNGDQMGIRDELFLNRYLVEEAFMALINEERNRIISNNIMTVKGCNDYIDENLLDIRKYAAQPEIMWEKALLLYNTLKHAQIKGDLPQDKTKESFAENKNCSSTTTDCGCGCKSDDTNNKVAEIENLISNCLEKIAYSIGRTGDHESAYMVERTLSEIKSQLKLRK